MPKLLEFYHDKKESEPLNLTKKEQDDLSADWEDIKYQREHRDKQAKTWKWAGSVYNVIQNTQTDDRISNITIGWIRSYIDTGIAQMTAGEPEFDFDALGPSDEARTLLWKNLVSTVMSNSNYMSHQNTAITDAHVFGPGVFEVFQQRPYRTIRVPQEDGSYKDEIIMDHRPDRQRVGVRAISPFRVTRNPNVSDLNHVGSCTKEEVLSWNQFVQNYGRVIGHDGKLKFKNIHNIPKGSHVKITHYQDEVRDVYRIYALSYGNESDGEAATPPEKLGIPIFDKPLKIHDIYGKKGELLRSTGLNLPGMCNLVFLPYADKLDDDFQTHNIYGMGLPEHMEGLDTFMQTAFNMTIDNWRMGNTVVLDIESRDGTVPSFDANSYYGGEYVNAKVTPQTLGQDRTVNFDNMYEVIQKLAIPGTGININAIAGDTSRTAFEFAQRIEANNKRSEMRLKQWESGPLKRLGTLLLSSSISELTVHDLERVREKDYKKVLKDIDKGRATRDDYEFENGKPVKRRNMFFVEMKGFKENFTKKRTSRELSVDSTENTLVVDKKSPAAVHKIPVTEQYVYPDWYADSGILFDTKVDSKRMITNKKIRDTQSIQSVIQSFLSLAQADPTLLQKVDSAKIFTGTVLPLAEVDENDVMVQEDEGEVGEIMKKIKEAREMQSAVAVQGHVPTQSPELAQPEQPNQPPEAPINPLA